MMQQKFPPQGKIAAKAKPKAKTKPPMFGKQKAATPTKPFAKGGAVDGVAKRGKTSTKMVKC